MKEPKYTAAIDQGTTSTRFIIFNHDGSSVCSRQLEHRQIFPKPGWVEHNPVEIWERTKDVISETLKKEHIEPDKISSIGITNQRETTVVWNPHTGEPYCNAIVWQDTRTSGIIQSLAEDKNSEMFRERTGLPLATYFSGPKIKWILDNIKGVREAAEKGDAVFGTIDTWILWQLTGGPKRGVHATDVTNASRTMLMDINKLVWDSRILDLLGIPEKMLPEIYPSITKEPYGYTTEEGPFALRIPVSGILGDQQAALFGQVCFEPGTSKNTYGTGCFLLANTGTKPVLSNAGLLTTVAYKTGDNPAYYALEGSVAVAGALVQWLRDNIGLIKNSSEIETLARKEKDSGGVYFVPAFSGLFAPRWEPEARGIVAGLTGYANSGHISRAVLEATAFQTKELVEAMQKDCGVVIPSLKVDGGMVVNELLMQFQADILNIPVIRPVIIETTALGAAYAAGLASGFWKSMEELSSHWKEDKRWNPAMEEKERRQRYYFWNKAVQKTLNWTGQGSMSE